ncbi:GGDEF domain-containing protein [Thalassolituus sp. LLYu03]|uniref:GGDEF domain-containing protein n=1 Tax=Thalassolituus sp. LLYu03 TaxID=3421656 RepID=UPI003D29E4A7
MSYREPVYRRNLLRVLLLLTAVSGFVFCALNVMRGMVILGLVELLAGAYSLMLYQLVPNARNLNRWILAYLIPFFTIMMFALAQPGTSETVFVWVFLIPQVSYLLTGVARGFVITGVYLLTSAVIFYLRFHDSGLLQPVAVANVITCALAVWSFAHHYEYSRARFSRKLLRIAERDSLTGLLNRMRMAELVESEVRNADARKQTVALILLDLDHFKHINDQYGHPVGDLALIHAADKLQSVVRKTDYVFRLGGEEFCILLPGADIAGAVEVAENVRRSLQEGGFRVEGREIPFTASFGVAVSGADGLTMVDLYHAADARMYAAKYAGRNRVVADDRAVTETPEFLPLA